MTRYSRSVIPGRPASDPTAADLDAIVFGRKGRGPAPAANDEDDDDFDDDEADHLVERATSDRRNADRRKAKTRRKSDFAPLPREGSTYRAPSEGSKRGPILLIGALVIVGVFSVVVWNAYRDGVRPEDSNTAPQLAEAGAFKTKPDAAVETSTSAEEASVFERVEAPRPIVAPAPEIREEPKAPPPAAAAPAPAPVSAPPVQTVAKPPVQTAAAAPAKSAVTQPAATKPAPAPAVATKPAPAQPALVQTAAAPKPIAVAPAPAPAATVPAPLQTAAAPAPESEAISLVGAPDYIPVFVRDGKYVVQIAAASTEAGANAEWDKRVKASPELFSGAAEKIIVQADVNGRTVYRVRVGAFGAAENAEGFCNAIKAKGGACFRTTR